MNKHFKVAAALIGIAILFPQSVGADGAIIPLPNEYAYETAQRAVIVHDGTTETLIISMTFEGQAEEFAWLIPTPNQPTVAKSTEELFTALNELTTPTYYESPPPYIFDSSQSGAVKNGVTVVESKQVDIYDITVLTARTSEGLSKWLKDKGYDLPASTPIFDDYLQNNWYFTAIKISTSAITDYTSNQLKTGHATPIQLQFQSQNIIYPLRISSITSTRKRIELSQPYDITDYYYPEPYPNYVTLDLYVLSDGKKTAPGYTTQYANWIKPDKVENLALDLNGNPWYSPQSKMYLTKVTRSMTTEEMTSDIIFRDADDNDPINAESTFDISPIGISIIVGIILGELILAVYFVKVRRRKNQGEA